MALVWERTIPTEQTPFVGEVSTNFLRIEVCCVTDSYSRNLGFPDCQVL
jgi:hypothetical protein